MTLQGDAGPEALDGRQLLANARRLVQIVLVLNIVLISTTVLLPRYTTWRLRQLNAQYDELRWANLKFAAARENYVAFFSADDIARQRLAKLAILVQQRLTTGKAYDATRAFAADLETQWDGALTHYAYNCVSPPALTKEDLQRQFLQAQEVLINLENRSIGAPEEGRLVHLQSTPIDHVAAFSCAIAQIWGSIDNPLWRDVDYGRPRPAAGDPTFDDTSHSALMDISAYQRADYDTFKRVPDLAAFSIAPFDQRAECELEPLLADYRAQLSELRREQASSRFAIPFIGISIDARSAVYATIAVMLTFLTEALIFHRSVLARRARRDSDKPRAFYFHTLLFWPRQDDVNPTLVQRARRIPIWVLSLGFRISVLLLLTVTPLAVAVMRLVSISVDGRVSIDLLVPALCIALTILILFNLFQLLALERRGLLIGPGGGYFSSAAESGDSHGD